MLRPSHKADYALRAVLDLALHARPGELTRTQEIARRTRAPSKYLEAILGQLGAAGLVESQRGARGGYRLSKPATAMTVGAVLRVAGVPLSTGARPGRGRRTDGPARAIEKLWERVDHAVASTIESVTLEDLARDAQEGAPVIDYSI